MFTTFCPGCESSLNAPDTLKGKKVKCKKCGEPFVARPAVTVDDDEPNEPRPANKRKKPIRQAVDDEDAELMEAQIVDDDEEPRPKLKKKKGKGKRKPEKKSPVMLFMLIGVGALILLGGGSVGAYYAFFNEEKKADTPQAKGGGTIPRGPKAAPADAVSTAGWVELREPDGHYSVKFPLTPQAMTQTVQTPMGQVEIKMHLAQIAKEKELFGSLHQAIPTERMGITDDQIIDKILEEAKANAQGATVSSTKPIKYQDFNGKDFVLTKPGEKGAMVMRVIIANDRVILLLAGGENGSADSPRVKAFFETLKIE